MRNNRFKLFPNDDSLGILGVMHCKMRAILGSDFKTSLFQIASPLTFFHCKGCFHAVGFCNDFGTFGSCHLQHGCVEKCILDS